eukprot:TRINITY_DN45247_c0_g1_i1.p1 TRINITY_DN45247_c0_g1~~TRINITY_DN45247_c0_g1_i1.p1  ORF type:complete len:832 (+),score=191.55 TRINITY_DN45247_c0_g1_i1:71-2566(+)
MSADASPESSTAFASAPARFSSPEHQAAAEQEASDRLNELCDGLAIAKEQAALVVQGAVDNAHSRANSRADHASEGWSRTSKSPEIVIECSDSASSVAKPSLELKDCETKEPASVQEYELPLSPTTPNNKKTMTPTPPTSSNKHPRPNGKLHVKQESPEVADSTKAQEECKDLWELLPPADGRDSLSKLDAGYVQQLVNEAVEQKLAKVDIEELKIEKLVRKCLDKEDIFSRPTTASAFGSRTSSGQATRSPQGKATWTSTDYWSLSAEPSTMFESTEELAHEDLESKLSSRLMSQQPDRRAAGIDEHLVRDVVNMTVRDIVGIFESLVDRLLIEKKGDTLKKMVTELMTDDIASTIALGQEQLKNREIAYLIEEMARLREAMRENNATWEQRFVVTEELGQAIENLRSDMEPRFQQEDARLAAFEQDYVRWENLDDHLLEITKEIKTGVLALDENTRQDAETSKLLRNLQRLCEESLATKDEMAQVQVQAEKDIKKTEEKMTVLIEGVRQTSAKETRVQDLQESIEEKLKTISQKLFEANRGIQENEAAIRKNSKFSMETYATKKIMEDSFSAVRAEAKTANDAVGIELGNLMKSKAEKTDLDYTNSQFRQQVKELHEANLTISNGLQELVASVSSLQGAFPNFATKDYSLDVARKCAEEVITNNSEKEEIAGLRREFAEERERARASVRQQQHNRKDLNSAMEELNDLRVKGSKMEQRCGSLEEKLTALVDKEAEHWEKSQSTLLGQVKNHRDLSTLCNAVREELAEHTERQRQESERLRDQTTLRYLEQLDKALHLNSGLDTLNESHKQLHDTVRNIHLPTIAGATNW